MNTMNIFSENNIAAEQRIAEANKKIVETEFKLDNLRPELKKLEVLSTNIGYLQLLNS